MSYQFIIRTIAFTALVVLVPNTGWAFMLQAPQQQQQQQQILWVPPPPQCTRSDFDANGVAEFVNSSACASSNPTNLNPWDATNPIWGVALDAPTSGCLYDYAAAWARIEYYKTAETIAQSKASTAQGPQGQVKINSLVLADRQNAAFVPKECQNHPSIQVGGKPQSITTPNDYRMVYFSGNTTSRYLAITLPPPQQGGGGGGGGGMMMCPLGGCVNPHLELQCHVDLTNYSAKTQYVHVDGRYAISEAKLPLQSDSVFDTAINEATVCACNLWWFVNQQTSNNASFTDGTFSDMLKRYGAQLKLLAGSNASLTSQAQKMIDLSANKDWSDGPPGACAAQANNFWTQQIGTLQNAANQALTKYNAAMAQMIDQTRVAVAASDKKIITLFPPPAAGAGPSHTQDVQNTAPQEFADSASASFGVNRTWYLLEPYQTLHLKYNNDLLYYQLIGGGDIRGTQVCSGVVEVCDDATPPPPGQTSEMGFLIGSGDIEYAGGSPTSQDSNSNPMQSYLSAPVSINGGKGF